MRDSDELINWLYGTLIVQRKAFDGTTNELTLFAMTALVHADVHDRPFDISSLALWLNIPRATCTRMINYWERDGLCTSNRDGRRMVIKPTKAAETAVHKYANHVAANPFNGD